MKEAKSRFILKIDGCPVAGADGVIEINGTSNKPGVSINTSTINQSNKKFDSCSIIKSSVNSLQDCKEFAKLVTLKESGAVANSVPAWSNPLILEDNEPGDSSCTLTLKRQCTDYNIKDANNNISITTPAGTYTQNSQDIMWQTFEGASSSTSGLKLTCNNNSVPYLYDNFHVTVSTSCLNPCKSFLIFEPKDGYKGPASIGENKDKECISSGYNLENIHELVGDTYLSVRCDGDVLITSNVNTIIPCANCTSSS